MKYRNTKTGFVFDSDTECKGEDWEKLNSPSTSKETKEEKPAKAKRIKNERYSR